MGLLPQPRAARSVGRYRYLPLHIGVNVFVKRWLSPSTAISSCRSVCRARVCTERQRIPIVLHYWAECHAPKGQWTHTRNAYVSAACAWHSNASLCRSLTGGWIHIWRSNAEGSATEFMGLVKGLRNPRACAPEGSAFYRPPGRSRIVSDICEQNGMYESEVFVVYCNTETINIRFI